MERGRSLLAGFASDRSKDLDGPVWLAFFAMSSQRLQLYAFGPPDSWPRPLLGRIEGLRIIMHLGIAGQSCRTIPRRFVRRRRNAARVPLR